MNDRDELLARVDLAELLVELTGHQGRGPAHACPNPDHDQTGKTPPVTISQPNGYQVWHCHACGQGGTAVDALVLARGLSVADAFAELRQRAGLDQPPTGSKRNGRGATEADLRRYIEQLTPEVAERLRELRGWSPEAIRSRELGFDGDRIVFPGRDSAGRLTGLLRYQPDTGRRNGKPKMLAAKGAGRELFPAPERVDGATVYAVEGEPDALAGHSLGLATVALPGAGKRDSAWWARIARGRERVVLVGDCDSSGRELAREAAEGCAGYCGDVRLVNLDPGRDDGWDLGDLLRELVAEHGAGGYAIARERLETAAEQAERFALTPVDHPYSETPQGLVWHKTPGHVERLANFTARIVAETTVDDGSGETGHVFTIRVRLHGGASRDLEVPVATFSGMSWVAEAGANAVLSAGLGARDRTREAIQLLSSPRQRRVYTHTGWVERDGRDVFLHAGGGIGPNGPVGEVEVRLPSGLERLELPALAADVELREAIRASLDLLLLGPSAVIAPVLCAVYRAPLGGADLSLHADGPTGVYKSELAALAQQHFGAGLGAHDLPGSWSSTANALEQLGFVAVDVLLVIDDFVAGGSRQDVSRQHQKADRVLRAQGNHSGRGRMNADSTLRASRPPRGLFLSTGEDVPQGSSLRGRMVIVELRGGTIKSEALSMVQELAGGGVYSKAMAGYIQWLAGRGIAAVRSQLDERTRQLRDHQAAVAHGRTPGNIASLAAGLEMFLAFAIEAGAISVEDAEAAWTQCWIGLLGVAALQAQHQADADPTRLFLSQLGGAVTAGRAHLAGPDGERPDDADAWGWRETGPGGDRIGWVTDAGDVYLEPEASYRSASRAAEDSSQPLNLSQIALHKALRDRGLIMAGNEKDGRLTVRPRLGGRRPRALQLTSTAAAELAGRVLAPQAGSGADPSVVPVVPGLRINRDHRMPNARGRFDTAGPGGPGGPGSGEIGQGVGDARQAS